MGLLLGIYKRVDLFDQCPVAVKKAKKAMEGHKSKGYVAKAAMQYFNWRFKYSTIYMVWCVGYLSDEELIVFMRRAKSQLITDDGAMRRSSTPTSFIIVLDNLLGEHEQAEVVKGQRLRTSRELETIFSSAGLLIKEKSCAEAMPSTYRDVMLWALY